MDGEIPMWQEPDIGKPWMAKSRCDRSRQSGLIAVRFAPHQGMNAEILDALGGRTVIQPGHYLAVANINSLPPPHSPARPLFGRAYYASALPIDRVITIRSNAGISSLLPEILENLGI